MAVDEASLAAHLRTWGKARVARGTVVRLTRTLLICEKPDEFFSEKDCWGDPKHKREDYHCECRRLCPRRERQSAGGACAAGGRREG